VASDKLELSFEQLASSREQVEQARLRLAEAREEVVDRREQLNQLPADDPAAAAAATAVEKAEELVARRERAIDDTIQRPYVDAGFTRVGPLSRAMTRARLAVFKDYSLPSLCGRDSLGRDVLSRIFWGARVSIIVSIVATLVSLVIGVTWGAVSGYCGGWVDGVMMRMVDVLYSVPFIFVVIFLLTILGEEQTK